MAGNKPNAKLSFFFIMCTGPGHGSPADPTTQHCAEDREHAIGMENKHIGANF